MGMYTLMTIVSFCTWKQCHLLVVVRTCVNVLYIQWFDEVLLLLPTIHECTTCSYYI